MVSAVLKVDPLAGDAIVTVGGVFATVIVTCAVAVAPSASVTLAVITCVPFDSRFVNAVPVPRAPSRLDDHAIDPVSDP